jgi:predicted nucleic acid-binding protein
MSLRVRNSNLTYDQLQEGDEIFLDANPFIYHFLGLSLSAVETSAGVRKQHGLLTNDSILVAVMKELGMNKLVTLDHDFDRVDWLLVYKPTDV